MVRNNNNILDPILTMNWPARPLCGDYDGYHFLVTADDRAIILDTAENAQAVIKQLQAENEKLVKMYHVESAKKDMHIKEEGRLEAELDKYKQKIKELEIGKGK